MSAVATAPPPDTSSPFVGLRRFDTSDSQLFFGRDEQIYELLRRLRLMHFLAVIGPSGCGKSSLIRAGVLAALRDGFMADDGEWRLVALQPGNGPLTAWTTALRPLARPGTPDERLVSDPAAVLDTSSGPIAILVDQFEELFHFVARTGKRAEADAFVEGIIRTGAPDARIFAILTMQSEYFAHCAEYPLLADAINSGLHLVSRMSADQIKEAIVRPVHRAGASITVALTDRLVAEAGGQSDGLPVLQHALMRMWAARKPLEPLGSDEGVTTRLGDFLDEHAEQVYRGLTPAQQTVAEQLFRALTEVTAAGNVVRRARELDAIQRERAVDPAVLRTVVEAFAKEGFLQLTATDGGNALVDLSHEAVARQWRRLGSTNPLKEGWVFGEARQVRAIEQLDRAALEWTASGRSTDFLFKGLRLQVASRYVTGREQHLSADGRAFLSASRTRDQRLKWVAPKFLVPVMGVVLIVATLSLTLYRVEEGRNLEKQRALLAETEYRNRYGEPDTTATPAPSPPAPAPSASNPGPPTSSQPVSGSVVAIPPAPSVTAPPTPVGAGPGAASPGVTPIRVRPRVYVQIRDESQRPEANRLAAALRDKDKGGFLVPDFQVVAIGPLRNELRYLDPGEREEAERAAAVLEGLGFPVSLQLVQLKTKGRARPQHYELWFAPGKAAY